MFLIVVLIAVNVVLFGVICYLVGYARGHRARPKSVPGPASLRALAALEAQGLRPVPKVPEEHFRYLDALKLDIDRAMGVTSLTNPKPRGSADAITQQWINARARFHSAERKPSDLD